MIADCGRALLLLSISRIFSRCLLILSLLVNFIFLITVFMSAYPLAFLGALASETIRPLKKLRMTSYSVNSYGKDYRHDYSYPQKRYWFCYFRGV
jgi:hypothetical protein